MGRVRGMSFGALGTMAVLGAADASAQFFVPEAPTGFDTAVVSVIGTGEVFVAPDRAVLFAQIVTRSDSPETATLANGETRSRVMEALVGLGYAEEDVGLWGYGAAPSRMEG